MERSIERKNQEVKFFYSTTAKLEPWGMGLWYGLASDIPYLGRLAQGPEYMVSCTMGASEMVLMAKGGWASKV